MPPYFPKLYYHLEQHSVNTCESEPSKREFTQIQSTDAVRVSPVIDGKIRKLLDIPFQ